MYSPRVLLGLRWEFTSLLYGKCICKPREGLLHIVHLLGHISLVFLYIVQPLVMSLIYHFLLAYKVKHDLIGKRISLGWCLIVLTKPLIFLPRKVGMVIPIRVVSVPIAIVIIVPKGWSLIMLNKVSLSLKGFSHSRY